VIWRAFRRSSASGPESSASESEAWWRDADSVAAAPDADAIAALAARLDLLPALAGDAEREREMIEGLRFVLELAANPSLPHMTTQHRVIGADVATVGGDSPAQAGTPGAVPDVSAHRPASGKTMAWPWHRIRRIVRRAGVSR
jgi:hypothetical protein